MEQLEANLAAAEFHLDADAMAALDAVSEPQPGGYPYGAFGRGQRSRPLDAGAPTQDLVAEGSDAPLGQA